MHRYITQSNDSKVNHLIGICVRSDDKSVLFVEGELVLNEFEQSC